MSQATNPGPDERRHLDEVSVSAVVRGWCASAANDWLGYELPALRDEPDAVHQMRVTTRRLRAILRRWEPVIATPVAELASELRWVAHALGDVRDLEVLRDRIVAALPEHAGEWAEAQLQEQRDRARAVLAEDFSLPRFDAVRAGVERLRVVGVVADWSQRPARRLVPIVRAQGLHARAAWDDACLDLRESPTQKQWELAHRARRAAKSARYLAEALDSQAPDQEVRAWAASFKRVADALGEVQDGVIAADFARSLAALPDAATRAALIALAEQEMRQQDNRLRDAFVAVQGTRAHTIQ